MRLEIHYTTSYTYSASVRGSLTALRLRPSTQPGLKVMSASLRARPGERVGSYVDGCGTATDLIESSAAHDAFSCEMHAVVETTAVEVVPQLASHEATTFRTDSSRVRIAAVAGLAATCGLQGGRWSSVEELNRWVNWRFSYRLGETNAETPIETVVETGVGVCQDFAHVLIALLRFWGWPARYVSGFQFNAHRDQRSIIDQAMHAWVEAYCPGIGWVGLDPTTGAIVDDRYVPVGRGRDYDDVRPVRGVLYGNALQSQTAQLRIEVLDDEASSLGFNMQNQRQD